MTQSESLPCPLQTAVRLLQPLNCLLEPVSASSQKVALYSTCFCSQAVLYLENWPRRISLMKSILSLCGCAVDSTVQNQSPFQVFPKKTERFEASPWTSTLSGLKESERQLAEQNYTMSLGWLSFFPTHPSTSDILQAPEPNSSYALPLSLTCFSPQSSLPFSNKKAEFVVGVWELTALWLCRY